MLHTTAMQLSPSPPVWVPLDELRQAWASFGAEALSCPALVATSTAFQALSWETSALRHHRMACQAQQRGKSQDASRWLSQSVQYLDEAVRNWICTRLWLERLTSGGTPLVCSESQEQVRELFEQAAVQQQRLQQLVGQVRKEQRVCGGGQAAVTAVTANSDAVASEAIKAQEEE